jgi:protein arginine kinase activator
MLCHHCQKNEATLSYTEIKEGKTRIVLLCAACAVNQGLLTPLQAAITNLGELLNEALKELVSSSEGQATQSCQRCGLTLAQFKKSGKLGCPECYRTFSAQLDPLLNRIHQSGRHLGKPAPASINDANRPVDNRKRKIDSLKTQLDRAVEKEEFELAASLRDQINGLKAEGSDGPN